MKLTNQKGMSLIEIFMSIGILSLVALGVPILMAKMTSQVSTSRIKRVQGIALNNIMEATRNNAALYQVDFNTTDDETANILKQQTLPWAIAGDNIVPRAECPECTEHFGYVIQPLVSNLNTRGLYYVTVRISNSLEDGDYNDMFFIVSNK